MKALSRVRRALLLVLILATVTLGGGLLMVSLTLRLLTLLDRPKNTFGHHMLEVDGGRMHYVDEGSGLVRRTVGAARGAVGGTRRVCLGHTRPALRAAVSRPLARGAPEPGGQG